MRALFSKTFFIFHFSFFIIFSSCSVSKKISQQADKILLQDSVINTGHIGISIYEPSTNKYWYNYNDEKYFIPASNTKLFTLYAGMKYLGDSLVGARYYSYGNTLYINPTGDPTFLYPDFRFQPLYDLIKDADKGVVINGTTDRITKYGKGWAYDDYRESYMTEKNKFPIFGNNLIISKEKIFDKSTDTQLTLRNTPIWVSPKYFANDIQSTASDANHIKIDRDIIKNRFLIEDDFKNAESYKRETIPFSTNYGRTSLEILQNIFQSKSIVNGIGVDLKLPDTILHSQPTDSLLKPMMHNSDNFFAEQTLLMVSNEQLGYMSDEDIIDTLVKNDFPDIPQKPKWVDGSGLSRYNLCTPKSFVYLLNKMQHEFGLQRLKNILPTGGEGTLHNYFINDSLYIYAKTGSLSNNNALSGFLITKKNKLLIFSILVNNFQGKATSVRKSVERFLQTIRDKN